MLETIQPSVCDAATFHVVVQCAHRTVRILFALLVGDTMGKSITGLPPRVLQSHCDKTGYFSRG